MSSCLLLVEDYTRNEKSMNISPSKCCLYTIFHSPPSLTSSIDLIWLILLLSLILLELAKTCWCIDRKQAQRVAPFYLIPIKTHEINTVIINPSVNQKLVCNSSPRRRHHVQEFLKTLMGTPCTTVLPHHYHMHA